MTEFQFRFLRVFIYLVELVFPNVNECLFEEEGKVVFTLHLEDGTVVSGENLAMKIEFGQFIDVKASPKDRHGNPSQIEAGSASFTLVATDKDGNDVSGSFARSDDGTDELHARWQHDGEAVEATGVVTLRADGDPDADETVDVVGTLDFAVDQPNTVAFDLEGTSGDPEPTPEA